MSFDIPRGVAIRVQRIDVRAEPGPHPYEQANLAAIEANWEAEAKANPALFDGRVMFLSRLRLNGPVLEGRCHEVRYATQLHWRKNRSTDLAEHAFGHAALISSDNALVAIRMAKDTANPGAIYFAAGSFEREDFIDGVCDVDANMMREVREETGIDLTHVRRDQDYVLFSLNHATAIFKRFWLDETADELAARIAGFVRGEARPEIEGAVILRDDVRNWPESVRPHMRAFGQWHYGLSPALT